MLQYRKLGKPASDAELRRLRRRAASLGVRITKNRGVNTGDDYYRISFGAQTMPLPTVFEIVETMWAAKFLRPLFIDGYEEGPLVSVPESAAPEQLIAAE